MWEFSRSFQPPSSCRAAAFLLKYGQSHHDLPQLTGRMQPSDATHLQFKHLHGCEAGAVGRPQAPLSAGQGYTLQHQGLLVPSRCTGSTRAPLTKCLPFLLLLGRLEDPEPGFQRTLPAFLAFLFIFVWFWILVCCECPLTQGTLCCCSPRRL